MGFHPALVFGPMRDDPAGARAGCHKNARLPSLGTHMIGTPTTGRERGSPPHGGAPVVSLQPGLQCLAQHPLTVSGERQ
eukprot:6832533-Prymnesium_polylepis.1